LKWYCCLPLLTILVTYKWWLEVQLNIASNWILEKDCLEFGIKARPLTLSKQILALKKIYYLCIEFFVISKHFIWQYVFSLVNFEIDTIR
jgi:hypothetical protein